MKLDIVNCDKDGLILLDGTTLPWSSIDIIGRCQHPCHDLTWAHHYLRKQGDPHNYKLPILGGFSFFGVNHETQVKQRDLRLKIIEHAKNFSHIRFLTRTPIFGTERSWDIDRETREILYCDSPEAQQERAKIKRLPIVMLLFFVALFLTFLIVLYFRK